MKILLLNPNIDAGHQIAQALRKDKMDLLLPENAREAWQLLHFHGNNLDLLIINREGPKESESEIGLKLVEKIKGDPQFSHIPLILTTLQWTEKECASHQQSSFGANAYLCGRIHEASLKNLIQALMNAEENSYLSQTPELELSPGADLLNKSIPESVPEPAQNQPSFISEGPLLEDVGQIFKSNPTHQEALGIKLELFEPPSSVMTGSDTLSLESASDSLPLSSSPPLSVAAPDPLPEAREDQIVLSEGISSLSSAPQAVELISPLETQASSEGLEPSSPPPSQMKEFSGEGIEISPAPQIELPEFENSNPSESRPALSADSEISSQSLGQSLDQSPQSSPPHLDSPTSPSLEISIDSKESSEAPPHIASESLPSPEIPSSEQPSESSFSTPLDSELPPQLPDEEMGRSVAVPLEASDLPPSIPPDDSSPSKNEAEASPLDAEVEQEMPYLFNSAPNHPSEESPSTQEIGQMVFSQPIGDAIVPGGVAHSPDVETLKKYLLLREQDVSILSNQLQSAKDQNLATEQLLREEKGKNSEMNHVIQELKQKIEDFEKTKASEMEILQNEINELRFQVKAKADKARKLETQTKELSEEMDRVKERVRIDIRKIRVREKELENRLELARKDSEALLSARENKIIELKRKLDLLEFNMDLLQDQYTREKENTVILKDRLAKAAQVVRVMGGLLDSNKKPDASES